MRRVAGGGRGEIGEGCGLKEGKEGMEEMAKAGKKNRSEVT